MANIGLIMNNLELIGYILNQFFIKTLSHDGLWQKHDNLICRRCSNTT